MPLVADDAPLAPPIEEPPAPDAAPLPDDGVDDGDGDGDVDGDGAGDEEPLLDALLPNAVEPDPAGLFAVLLAPPALEEPLLPLLLLLLPVDAAEVEPEAELGIGDTVGLVPAAPADGPAPAPPPIEPLLPVPVLLGDVGLEPEDDALSMPNACLEPSDAAPAEVDDALEGVAGVPEAPIDPLPEVEDDEDGAGAGNGVAEDPELLVKAPLEGFTPATESVSDLPDNEVLEA